MDSSRPQNPYQAPASPPPAPPGQAVVRAELVSGEAPSHVRYKVLAFLLVLSFLTYFDRICIVRAQDDIIRDLGLTKTQFGLVLSVFWFAYAVFEIPGGWLGDRYGARGTLTRVVLAWSLFTALSGSASSFAMLVTFRFLFGAGEAGAYPNMALVQSNWVARSERARAGGMLWLAARWGGAFSPMLFAGLMQGIDWLRDHGYFSAVPAIEASSSWRIGFWCAGLLGVGWCLGFYPWFRDDPAQKSGVNAAELAIIREGRTGAPAKHAIDGKVFLSLLKSKSLWAMAFLYISGSFGWSFFVSWAPEYLKVIHGLELSKSDPVWKQPLFYGGISCLTGGLLCDLVVRKTGWRRVGRAIFPLTGYITASVAIFSVQFVSNAEQAVWLICLAGAAYDFGQGANWASIVDIGGRNAGTAAGFINMLGNMGNSLQPVIGAYIFSNYGWGPLFVTYSVAFLIAASMWLIIDPRKPFHEEPAHAA